MQEKLKNNNFTFIFLVLIKSYIKKYSYKHKRITLYDGRDVKQCYSNLKNDYNATVE